MKWFEILRKRSLKWQCGDTPCAIGDQNQSDTTQVWYEPLKCLQKKTAMAKTKKKRTNSWYLRTFYDKIFFTRKCRRRYNKTHVFHWGANSFEMTQCHLWLQFLLFMCILRTRLLLSLSLSSLFTISFISLQLHHSSLLCLDSLFTFFNRSLNKLVRLTFSLNYLRSIKSHRNRNICTNTHSYSSLILSKLMQSDVICCIQQCASFMCHKRQKG